MEHWCYLRGVALTDEQRGPRAAWLYRHRVARFGSGIGGLEALAEELRARGAYRAPDTIKGWEAGGSPIPPDVTGHLEEIFDDTLPSPVKPVSSADLIAALAAQTAAIGALVDRLPIRISAMGERVNVTPVPTVRKRRQYWLRLARARHRWTVARLDKELNRPAGTYSGWESGKTDPRGAEIANLARTLDIPEPWITSPPETDEERVARVHFDDGDAAIEAAV